MWIKLTEAKESKRSVLLNTDNIAYMSVSDKGGTDTYIKIKESEAQNTFYFVKESIEEIYKMLCSPPKTVTFPIDYDMGPNKHLDTGFKYTPSVR